MSAAAGLGGHRSPSPRRPATGRLRRAGTVGAVVAAAAVGVTSGTAAHALFTSGTRTTGRTVTAGRLTLQLGANQLTQPVTALTPEDGWVYRAVDVAATGSIATSAVTLSVTATGTDPLASDASSGGLQMQVVRCDAPFTASTTSTGQPTCPGSSVVVLPAGPALRTAQLGMPGLAPGAVAHLAIGLSIPAGHEGESTPLTYTFRASQRPATTTNG